MTIKVMCGDNLDKGVILVQSTSTLREAFAQRGVDCSRGMTHLNGSPVSKAELDKTFEDFGLDLTQMVWLLNVVKADNA